MRPKTKAAFRPLLASVATVASALFVLGCEGEIAAPSGPMAQGGSDSGLGAGGGGGPTSSSGSGAIAPAPGELSSPFTRLTRAEYKATIKAAFDIDASVTGIPGDQRIGNFTSNVVDIDPAHEFLLASEELAAKLVPGALPVCTGASAASCITTSYQAPLERLYRRPLTAGEVSKLAGLVGSIEAAGVNAEGATRGMLVSALMGSDFLFRANPLSGDAARGRRLAEHLAYALWDAPPDAALVAATQGDVATVGSRLKEQALRLGGDQRAVPVMARFLAQWLFVDVDSKLEDNSQTFSASPLYAELLAFAKNALSSRVSVKSFVNGTQGFVQKDNFKAYAMQAPPGSADVALVNWDTATARRGLISQELFLDATRHPTKSRRPIFRGHLVRTSFLCEPIVLPPGNVVDLDAEVQDRTVDARCMGCHLKMDPIGRAFATLDQDNEAGSPAPEVVGDGEIHGSYADLPSLLDAIAESQVYADCFARNLLGFFLEQDPEHVDAASVADVAAVVKTGGSLSDALAQVALSLDLRSRAQTPWCTGE
jgi:hypothetical protein